MVGPSIYPCAGNTWHCCKSRYNDRTTGWQDKSKNSFFQHLPHVLCPNMKLKGRIVEDRCIQPDLLAVCVCVCVCAVRNSKQKQQTQMWLYKLSNSNATIELIRSGDQRVLIFRSNAPMHAVAVSDGADCVLRIVRRRKKQKRKKKHSKIHSVYIYIHTYTAMYGRICMYTSLKQQKGKRL